MWKDQSKSIPQELRGTLFDKAIQALMNFGACPFSAAGHEKIW